MSDPMTALSNVLSLIIGIVFYAILIGFAGYALIAAVISLIDGFMCLFGLGHWKRQAAEFKYRTTRNNIERLETELGMRTRGEEHTC